ncbi:MAG: RluA family pseudouridine synthase [Chloroflexi bacterium]|nr:RluA family pseudouridine synthase [Chloroflexota bacterium]
MSERYQEVEFVVAEASGRLDKTLAERFEQLSRAQVQNLIQDGQVMVNGRLVKSSYRVEGGETIWIKLPLPEEDLETQPESIALDILYEDQYLAVINKPAGMVVHPATGHTTGTLVNAVLARWPEIAAFSESGRAGIVHRLDKETSGVILIAKTEKTLNDLRVMFKDRQIHKRYIALVEGVPDAPDGVIDAPIGRDPKQRKRMAVVRDGRDAVTEFHVLDTYSGVSLLEVFPKTGRTHQIRVHLAFIGHPVIGDGVYGSRKQQVKLKRYFLHASSITLTLPENIEPLTVTAPLPVGLQNVLDKLPR